MSCASVVGHVDGITSPLRLAWDRPELWFDTDRSLLMSSLPTIALIDDDPLFAELFKEFSRSRGYLAETFSSAIRAPDPAAMRNYSFILVDMDLGPGGPSGLEFANTIKATVKDIPVILISGDTFVGFDNKGPGIDAFITKRLGLEVMLQEAVNIYKSGLQ